MTKIRVVETHSLTTCDIDALRKDHSNGIIQDVMSNKTVKSVYAVASTRRILHMNIFCELKKTNQIMK